MISSNEELKGRISSIPDKLGFKIGEVAEFVGVKQYVLRYWETEFDMLKPKKSANGQRVYTKKDIQNALIIRKLLHIDRFSIEGARSVLKRLKSQGQTLADLDQQVEEPANTNVELPEKGKVSAGQLGKALALQQKELQAKFVISMTQLLGEVKKAKRKLLA